MAEQSAGRTDDVIPTMESEPCKKGNDDDDGSHYPIGSTLLNIKFVFLEIRLSTTNVLGQVRLTVRKP